MKQYLTNYLFSFNSKLKVSTVLFFIIVLLQVAYSQPHLSRIHYAGKDIFVSGINIAWVNFSADLGPNPPDLKQFRMIFQSVRNNGGNALRLWLNTNGTKTPAYNYNGYVTGPGAVAIQNLKQILSLARLYDVGLILCLWSFDMLHKPEFTGRDSVILSYNYKLLTDTSYTMAYIRNALVPMVDSVKGDTAIIAWEVCNEPNGMTTGMNYYPGDPTVPISTIQRFTNLIAGAIHRADPNALVTIGAGSFQTLTDVNPTASIKKSQLKSISSLPAGELQEMTNQFNIAHRLNLTSEQMLEYLQKVAILPDSNYYRDDRLISAGGDSSGILDFYCVHYYSTGSTILSPFIHPFSYWNLNKPVVVAEFYMQATDGIPDSYLFPNLYQSGYAGALVWSWTDFSKTPGNALYAEEDTWAALQSMRRNMRQDIDVFGADWPIIAITSPLNNSMFPDSTHLTLSATVIDTGASVTSVKFFATDSLIGEVDTPLNTSSDTLYYSFEWKNIVQGTYTITALAVNSQGSQDLSNAVTVSIGKPPMTRLEAEKAMITGGGIAVKGDPSASGGYFLDITTNDTSAKVTWRFNNVSTAGNYPISFGYQLKYDTPKEQFINVNGVRVDTLTFDGPKMLWLEKTITVNLVQGENTVQMQMWWGWMYLDYLAVPTSILTSITNAGIVPVTFSLFQNYPNPFNPTTKIKFSLTSPEMVKLTVYNVLGQKVETLIDQRLASGEYTVDFDGSKLASGVYFYRLQAGKFDETREMVLLK